MGRPALASLLSHAMLSSIECGRVKASRGALTALAAEEKGEVTK